MSATAADDAFVVEFAFLMVLALAIYVVPSVIAFSRRHPNRYAILAINIVFGGTGIGWVGALIWALHVVHLHGKPGGSAGGESGLNLFLNDIKPVRLASATEAVGAESAEAGVPISAAAAIAELERLGRLKADGHLSDVEYATLKRSLLGRVRARVRS